MSYTNRKISLQNGSLQIKLLQPSRRFQPSPAGLYPVREKGWDGIRHLVNQLSITDPFFPFSPPLVMAQEKNIYPNYFNLSFLYLFFRRLLT